MWFAEQLDSFLNLGICKEYPMARSKSISGSKANRTVAGTDNNKEQTKSSSPANIPDGKAVTAGMTPAEVAAEAMVTAEARKLEVVKTEPRRNVVPINQAAINQVSTNQASTNQTNQVGTKQVPNNRAPINLEDEIRRRAYELYLQRGTAAGSEGEDWLNAEREILQCYHQQSA
jgi:hypothetical protein